MTGSSRECRAGSIYEPRHGSGLRLSAEEYAGLIERYLTANGLSREEFVEDQRAAMGEAPGSDDLDGEYGEIVLAGAAELAWHEDMHAGSGEARRFGACLISPECSDGMTFRPFRGADGKPNVPFLKDGNANPAFIDEEDLRLEDSYLFFCDRTLDGPASFDERPYGSYEEYRQEFVSKMRGYLPEDFRWDAHIGRFDYALC